MDSDLEEYQNIKIQMEENAELARRQLDALLAEEAKAKESQKQIKEEQDKTSKMEEDLRKLEAELSKMREDNEEITEKIAQVKVLNQAIEEKMKDTVTFRNFFSRWNKNPDKEVKK